MTEADFDKQVLEIGLAQKAAARNINQRLLGMLVDREVMCDAARSAGLSAEAEASYTKLKSDKRFQQELKQMRMSDEQVKEEVIKAELMRLITEKVQKGVHPSDRDITSAYSANLNQFKHGERIKLAQIVVAAPQQDSPFGQAVATQLKKKNPGLTPADLDLKVKVTMQQLNQRAVDLLQRALKGEDFAKLANENTDDPMAAATKNGGDLGYQEMSQTTPDFAKKIAPLKPGQVCPEVIVTPLGFHIMKLVDRQPAGATPLAEVKDDIVKALTANQQKLATLKWLQTERAKAKIVIAPEFKDYIAGKGKATTTETASKDKAKATETASKAKPKVTASKPD